MDVVANKMIAAAASRPDRRASLNSLQAGRAVAALLVCAFHLSVLFGGALHSTAGSFHDLTWWGFRGVDFFFVLSGFIILFAHHADIGHPGRAAGYLFKRISRVYPVYWVYTGLFVFISALGSGVLVTPLKDPGGLASTLLLVRFGSVDPPISVAWTLFHEIIFYAVFTTLIVHRRLGVAILTSWLVGILVFQTWPSPHTLTGTLFSTFNLNFFFGMLAFVVHRRAGPVTAKALVAAGVAGTVLCLIVDARAGGSIAVQVGFAAAFAAMIAGCAALERTGGEWRLRALVVLGDASYSLYLVHTGVQVYLLKGMQQLPVLSALPAPIMYLSILAGTVALGVAAHVMVERPLTRLTRTWSAARHRRTG